jgi:hypothetical protein
MEAVNPLLADVADANAPALVRLRARPAGFLWNPWISAGVPGGFELAQGLLSPFAWLPALLLPEAAIETGILFLKAQFAFVAMWLFLRRRRFADAPAALGAAAWAFSTGQTAWGLWMQSSVSVTYPLLLLSVDLAFRAPARRALAFAAASVLLFLLGGFPHWLVYGALAAGLSFAFEAGVRPRRAARAALLLAAAGAIAVTALLPSILAAARVLTRAGYGELRSHPAPRRRPFPRRISRSTRCPPFAERRSPAIGGRWAGSRERTTSRPRPASVPSPRASRSRASSPGGAAGWRSSAPRSPWASRCRSTAAGFPRGFSEACRRSTRPCSRG